MLRFIKRTPNWIAITSIATIIMAIATVIIALTPLSKSFHSSFLSNTNQLKKIKAAEEAIKAGQIDNAIKLLENIPEENKSEEATQYLINSYFIKGALSIGNGQYEEGINWYWKAYNKFPNICRTKTELIKNLSYVRRRSEEKQDFEIAIKSAKDLYFLTKRPLDKIEIGRLLNEWGEKDLKNNNPFSAIGKFEDAIENDPTDQAIANNLSHTYRWIGEVHARGESLRLLDLAIEYYFKAEKIEPNIVNQKKIAFLYFRKYKLFNKLEQTFEAEDCLTQIIIFDAELILRENLEAEEQEYMLQAAKYMDRGKYKEAGFFLRLALLKNLASPYLYYMQTTRNFYAYYKFKRLSIGNLRQSGFMAWNKTKTFAETKLNLNKADLVELKLKLKLPFDKLIRIIENRPYQSIDELLVKKILGQKEFDCIKKLVSVR